jgi:hypothetical protein
MSEVDSILGMRDAGLRPACPTFMGLPPIRKGSERFDAKIKHFRPFGFVGSSVYSIVWPS